MTRGQRLGVGWRMGPQDCRNPGSQRGRKGMATGLSREATAFHIMLSLCENSTCFRQPTLWPFASGTPGDYPSKVQMTEEALVQARLSRILLLTLASWCTNVEVTSCQGDLHSGPSLLQTWARTLAPMSSRALWWGHPFLVWKAERAIYCQFSKYLLSR